MFTWLVRMRCTWRLSIVKIASQFCSLGLSGFFRVVVVVVLVLVIVVQMPLRTSETFLAMLCWAHRSSAQPRLSHSSSLCFLEIPLFFRLFSPSFPTPGQSWLCCAVHHVALHSQAFLEVLLFGPLRFIKLLLMLVVLVLLFLCLCC